MTAELPSGPTNLPGWLTGPASRLYAVGAGRRAARFDQGRGVVRIDRPVISVGNLSVGGTGKTPVVGWVIERLRAMGHDPVVAMRGYRSRGGVSDEAALHTERFDDLPVVARPDRLEGLIDLFATQRGERVDVVVLDDGFQHRRIARDLDLVLLDATRDVFEDRLLPAGWLREPVGALHRGTHFAITHAEAVGSETIGSLDSSLMRLVGKPADGVLSHGWAGLEIAEGGKADRTEPVGWLSGRSVVVACAIGNPRPFLMAVGRATGREVAARVFADHHAFDRVALRGLFAAVREQGAQALVVTAKDWTKMKPLAEGGWPCPVVRPRLQIGFERGEAELAQAIERVMAEHTPDAD